MYSSTGKTARPQAISRGRDVGGEQGADPRHLALVDPAPALADHQTIDAAYAEAFDVGLTATAQRTLDPRWPKQRREKNEPARTFGTTEKIARAYQPP